MAQNIETYVWGKAEPDSAQLFPLLAICMWLSRLKLPFASMNFTIVVEP